MDNYNESYENNYDTYGDKNNYDTYGDENNYNDYEDEGDYINNDQTIPSEVVEEDKIIGNINFTQYTSSHVKECIDSEIYAKIETIDELKSHLTGTDENGYCRTCENKKDCTGHMGFKHLVHTIVNPIYESLFNNIIKCVCMVEGCNYTKRMIYNKDSSNNRKSSPKDFESMFKDFNENNNNEDNEDDDTNSVHINNMNFDDSSYRPFNDKNYKTHKEGCLLKPSLSTLGLIRSENIKHKKDNTPYRYLTSIKGSNSISSGSSGKSSGKRGKSDLLASDSKNNNRTDPVSLDHIYRILDTLDESRLRVLGWPIDDNIPKPSCMILQYIPIMPNYMRSPLIKQDKDDMVLHCITKEYERMIDLLNRQDIKANNQSYRAIAHILYSNILGVNKGTGSLDVSIKSFITGKQGMIRKYMLSPRINNSARTVLTGSITVRPGVIMVPECIASQIYTYQSGGTRKQLSNGDYVFINRNPTLSANSLNGYRVKLHKGKTIMMNVNEAAAFNADFDGDEVNMFVPQYLNNDYKKVSIVNNIISRNNSLPCYGPVQDGIVGIYMLSIDNPILSEYDFSECLYNLGIDVFEHRLRMNEENSDIDPFSGHSLLSTLFPHDFNFIIRKKKEEYNNKNKNDIGNSINVKLYLKQSSNSKYNKLDKYNKADKYETIFEVRNGVFIKGELDINKIWKSKTDPDTISTDVSIVSHLVKRYGSECAANFMYNAQLISVRYLKIIGFSLSMKDFIHTNIVDITLSINKSFHEDLEIERKITEMNTIHKLDASEDQLEDLKYKALTGKLQTNIRLVRDTLKSEWKHTSMAYMINSGAKGDPNNYTAAVISLGQQSIGMSRPRLSYKNIEDPIRSRGYCVNSFLSGLDPWEFVFQAYVGRNGNIKTAISSKDSGHDYRTAVTFMCNLRTCSDGTIRDHTNKIIKIMYGSCNSDLIKSGPNLEVIDIDNIINSVRSDN